jgi:hypothetical protein
MAASLDAEYSCNRIVMVYIQVAARVINCLNIEEVHQRALTDLDESSKAQVNRGNGSFSVVYILLSRKEDTPLMRKRSQLCAA